MKKVNKNKGFTIIEVVLVLAIAALIFFMVFTLVPTLQSNYRDNARRQDVAAILTSANTYYSVEGKYIKAPSDMNSFKKYMNNLGFYDSENVFMKNPITEVNPQEVSDSITSDEIWIYPSTKCDNNQVKRGSVSSIAVVTKLEAGNGTIHCQGY